MPRMDQGSGDRWADEVERAELDRRGLLRARRDGRLKATDNPFALTSQAVCGTGWIHVWRLARGVRRGDAWQAAAGELRGSYQVRVYTAWSKVVGRLKRQAKGPAAQYWAYRLSPGPPVPHWAAAPGSPPHGSSAIGC